MSLTSRIGVDRFQGIAQNPRMHTAVGSSLTEGAREMPVDPAESLGRSGECSDPFDDRRYRCVGRLQLAVIAFAVFVRIAAILVLRSHEVPRSTYEHGEIAENLLSGRGFRVMFLGNDGPTSQQAPLYPVCVAAAYWLGGIGTPRAILILSVAQAFLSGLLVWGTIRLARGVAPERPFSCLLAGAVVAFHPTLIYATTHVQVVLLATTLLTWLLVWSYRIGETGRVRDARLAGALLCLVTLTDPILALGFAGTCLAIARGPSTRNQTRIQRLRLAATVFGVALLGGSPWIARNYAVHGEFVAIKSSFGYAFWQGNSALSQGTDKVVRPSVEKVLGGSEKGGGLEGLNRTLWAARHEAGYLDDIALTRDDYRMLGAVSEPERSRILFRRALDDLAKEPGRYVRLCLHRLRAFVFFDESNPKTRVMAYRVGHLGLTVLAGAGLIVASSGLRRRFAPMLLVAAMVTAFHALTIISARFHIPLEPMMAVWGATGLANLGGFRSPSESAWSPGEVVGVGVEGRLGVTSGP